MDMANIIYYFNWAKNIAAIIKHGPKQVVILQYNFYNA